MHSYSILHLDKQAHCPVTMGDTTADLIDLSSIEQITPNNGSIINSVATSTDQHQICDSIKQFSLIKMHSSPQPLFNESTIYTTTQIKDTIEDFEAKFECFMKTKILLLKQFEEETQKLTQKHEREIMGIRQKHSICEDNFK